MKSRLNESNHKKNATSTILMSYVIKVLPAVCVIEKFTKKTWWADHCCRCEGSVTCAAVMHLCSDGYSIGLSLILSYCSLGLVSWSKTCTGNFWLLVHQLCIRYSILDWPASSRQSWCPGTCGTKPDLYMATIIIIIKAIYNAQDPPKAANALSGSEKVRLSIYI